MKLFRDMSSEENRNFWLSLEESVAAAKLEMPTWLKEEIDRWYSSVEVKVQKIQNEENYQEANS